MLDGSKRVSVPRTTDVALEPDTNEIVSVASLGPRSQPCTSVCATTQQIAACLGFRRGKGNHRHIITHRPPELWGISLTRLRIPGLFRMEVGQDITQ
jgi:hypothetical protein